MKKNAVVGNLMLLTAALIWGLAFVAQSVGADRMAPMTFQFCRSLTAVLTLIPLVAIGDRGKNDGKTFFTRFRDKRLLLGGLCCGLGMFLGNAFQQVGLVYTSPGKSGFITAMYIVLVPLLGLFLHQRLRGRVWISVGLAVLGLYFLSLSGADGVNLGDALTLVCALFFAIQITCIDRVSPYVDCLRLSLIQTMVTCVLSFFSMLLFEGMDLSAAPSCAVPILYTGVLSMGIAYTLQITGQKKSSNVALASLILSLESVFSALFGWLILKAALSPRELFGCVLVFGAIVLAQLPAKKAVPA